MRELTQLAFYESSATIARMVRPNAQYTAAFLPPGNTDRGVAKVSLGDVTVADAWLDAMPGDDVSEELAFMLDIVRAYYAGGAR